MSTLVTRLVGECESTTLVRLLGRLELLSFYKCQLSEEEILFSFSVPNIKSPMLHYLKSNSYSQTGDEFSHSLILYGAFQKSSSSVGIQRKTSSFIDIHNGDITELLSSFGLSLSKRLTRKGYFFNIILTLSRKVCVHIKVYQLNENVTQDVWLIEAIVEITSKDLILLAEEALSIISASLSSLVFLQKM